MFGEDAEDSGGARVLTEKLHNEVVGLVLTDITQAEQLAERAWGIAEETGDRADRAFAERAYGHVRYAQADYPRAIGHYEQAVGLFEQVGRTVDAARTRTGALQTLIYLGRYDQAIGWAAVARSVFEEAGDKLRLARLDSNTGNLLYRQDRYQEALVLYERAYRQFLELGEARDVAAALSNLAVCSISLQDYETAVGWHEQAREWCQRHGMPVLVAEADYNIAYLHFLRGEYTKAIRLYEAARQSAEESGDAYHRALCDLDQSEMYLELNLLEEGSALAKRALEGFEKLAMTYETAKAMSFLAIAQHQRGQHRAALRAFSRARRLFLAEGNRIWCGLVDLYRAMVLFRQGRDVAALKAASRARRMCIRAGLNAKTALCELLATRVQLRRGRMEQARAGCRRVLAHLADQDHPAVSFHAEFVMGQIEEASGNAAEAKAAYDRARMWMETLRSRLSGDSLKIAFLKDKLAVYENLVRLTEDPEAVFGLMEQAKSRSLADLIAFQAQNLTPLEGRGIAPPILRLRQELNACYRQIEEAFLAVKERAGAERAAGRIGELWRKAREGERQLSSRMTELRAMDREFAALQEPLAVDLGTIQEALDGETTLVEYYRGRDRLYAALVTRGSLEIFELGGAGQLDDLLRLLRFQLAKFRLGKEYEEAFGEAMERAALTHLRQLYGLLVAPVRGRLKTRHLLVVPHGAMHHLPFHALTDGKRFLVDDFTVSYAPSGSVYALCGQRGAPATTGSLVMGVADQGAPFIEEEARRTAGVLPGAELYLGDRATAAVFRDKGLEARYVHVAAHGTFRQDNPLFSSIRLGGEPLNLCDIYHLRLDAELVALSGCSTGLNVVVGGDELLGLSRGLLHAGARGILLSLWDVNDRSTARLMEAFYGGMMGGEKKAEALRGAMLGLREEKRHPYYWAPFVLIGQV